METINADHHWRVLATENSNTLPELLYRCTATPRSFNVKITDITYVWSCSLDHDAILREARESSCSIDPSESASQFKTLLAKLKDSLRDGRNALTPPKTTAAGSFALHTTLWLPAPLHPLHWVFKLERLDATEHAREITVPVLEQLSASAEELQSLLQVIKEKDHVITKLLDKIEGSAIDLSLIFPGITGLKHRRHRVSVAEASKHVPGLANFDRAAWAAETSSSASDDDHHIKTLSSALADCDAKESLKRSSEDWISSLPHADDSKSKQASKPTTSPPVASHRRQPNPSSSSTSSDEDFETQRTPPSAAKALPHDAVEGNGRSSNDSDTDTFNKPAPTSTKGRLGTIGRSRLAAGSRAGSSNAQKDQAPTTSSTASDSDTAPAASKPKPNSKGPSRLGKLGGRRKQPTPARSSSPTPPPKAVSSAASTPSRKLGVLGGRKKQTASQAATENQARARQPTPPPRPQQSKKPQHDRDAGDEVDVDGDGDIDLDSDATASDADSPTRSPLPEATKSPTTDTRHKPKTTSSRDPSSSAPAPDPPPAPSPETEEAAKARRREELKRTLASGGGPKKKRKF